MLVLLSVIALTPLIDKPFFSFETTSACLWSVFSSDYVYDNPDELKRAEKFVKKLKDQPYNESKIYKLD